MGICLGMHILFDYGDELFKKKGLSLIKGNIKKINLAFSNHTKKCTQFRLSSNYKKKLINNNTQF